ncbi:unnamed protein product [Heligmosomoides polygyrus]|uniref:Uncharacterized protein n=1 Tax=Heligmosomoides polygyrus TaxID=6339 RepID=A0A183G989_HELPZ|nr:unnamed protein product [Heligmosomoides polygyrus]
METYPPKQGSNFKRISKQGNVAKFCDEEDVEAFYVELEKCYKEDHTFYKVIVGDFNANTGSRRLYCLTDVSVVPTGSDHRLRRARFRFSHQGEKAAKSKKGSPRTTINWTFIALLRAFAKIWDDTVMDNIDEEYDRFVRSLRECSGSREVEDHQNTSVSGNFRADTPAWSSTSVMQLQSPLVITRLKGPEKIRVITGVAS